MARKEITCPNCAHAFALDDAINHELEISIRERVTAELDEKQALERMRIEREAAERSSHALNELESRVRLQQKELERARESERALLELKIELQDRAEKARLEAQRELAGEREKIRQIAQQQVVDAHQLQDAEKNKQLEDLRRQIDDLKRKAEQGPQQLQGDVQELELEKALRDQFPMDGIEPIKTGVRGADVLQTVVSDDGKICGTILWESKRVRHWQDAFVDKLLRDKSDAKADLAIIVTDAMPEHVLHMSTVKGVLLTKFSLAICLASTLRVNMALLGHTRLSLAGQEDQKSRLFEYFMSPAFHEKMRMIADQMTQMQDDLRKERSWVTRSWAKRQQQLDLVMAGTAGLAGTLQAFYGPALPPMPQFELPVGSDE